MGRGSRAGYGIVLLGAASFVVSCFLPLQPTSNGSVDPVGVESLFQSFMNSGATAAAQAGWLAFLFAGVAVVAAVAVVGIRRDPPKWTPAALAPVAASWAFTWVGILAAQAPGTPVKFGYWCILAGVAVAVAGTVVVLVCANREVHQTASPAEVPVEGLA
jgi:hypothetical protein